jgi:hypothetical protein
VESESGVRIAVQQRMHSQRLLKFAGTDAPRAAQLAENPDLVAFGVDFACLEPNNKTRGNLDAASVSRRFPRKLHRNGLR